MLLTGLHHSWQLTIVKKKYVYRGLLYRNKEWEREFLYTEHSIDTVVLVFSLRAKSTFSMNEWYIPVFTFITAIMPMTTSNFLTKTSFIFCPTVHIANYRNRTIFCCCSFIIKKYCSSGCGRSTDLSPSFSLPLLSFEYIGTTSIKVGCRYMKFYHDQFYVCCICVMRQRHRATARAHPFFELFARVFAKCNTNVIIPIFIYLSMLYV